MHVRRSSLSIPTTLYDRIRAKAHDLDRPIASVAGAMLDRALDPEVVWITRAEWRGLTDGTVLLDRDIAQAIEDRCHRNDARQPALPFVDG